jgi:glycosyltransferase involved in cell wall biosynthesis
MFAITDLHRGGSPLLLAELAPGLQRRGWDVEVVSIAHEGEVAELLRARGVRVTSLEAWGNRDVRVVGRFVTLLRRRRPEVVFTVLVHANLLAALALPLARRGAKAWVQSIHTVQEKPAWHWVVQGMISQRADAVVAPAAAVIQKMQDFGPVPRTMVIPNGIDVRRFYEARSWEDVPWPKGVRVVGYIGRFDVVKRLEVLVAAMGTLAGWHLALAGYGPTEGTLRKQVAELGLTERVHFVGATKEPERWHKAFDVFCSPSVGEGYGLTLAEATAAGVPVVACDTEAVRETVEAAAWLSEEGDGRELAGAIEAAALGKKRCMSLSELEKRYSLERMVEAYAVFLEELREEAALQNEP